MIDHNFLAKRHGRKNSYTFKIGRDVRALAKALGVKIAKTDSPYVWDGSTVNTGKMPDAADVIHDLCHFMLCEPGRRHMPDYGLGPAPETDEKVECLVKDPINEEGAVSLLGCLIEIHLGYDHITTMLRHYWMDEQRIPPKGYRFAYSDNLSIARVDAVLTWFTQNGFIDDNGIPLMKLRTNEILPKSNPSYSSF